MPLLCGRLLNMKVLNNHVHHLALQSIQYFGNPLSCIFSAECYPPHLCVRFPGMYVRIQRLQMILPRLHEARILRTSDFFITATHALTQQSRPFAVLAIPVLPFRLECCIQQILTEKTQVHGVCLHHHSQEIEPERHPSEPLVRIPPQQRADAGPQHEVKHVEGSHACRAQVLGRLLEQSVHTGRPKDCERWSCENMLSY